MKTWKYGIFGILAIFALAFTACDDGNGKEKKDPCPCTDKVHYDTPCDCVGVGNDCDCTVYYKPALTDVFTFRTTATQEVQDKVIIAYDEIWASNPQLILRLASAVGVKGTQLDVAYGTSVFEVTFNPEYGRIRITSPDFTSVDFAEFTTAFESAIGEACDYYESL